MEDVLADPLARDLYEAEFRHREDGDLRAILPELLLELLVHLSLVPLVLKIDEITHDNAADVAEAELPADFPRGFKVCPQRILFLFLLGRVASAVHVDHHHRLGGLDDDVSAALEPDFPRERRLDLLLDSVDVENRRFVPMQFDLVEQAGTRCT